MAEDDTDLLELTSAILGQHADVTCASETTAAIRLLCSRPFDLLITDLNIVRPCDGLLLAGLMRYLNPDSNTVLITGYPDFTSAIAALQALLDLTLIKPVPVQELRNLIRPETYPARAAHELGHISLWVLIDRHKGDILGDWLKLVEQDAELSRLPLTPADRMDHLVEILDHLTGGGAGPGDARVHAERHGKARRVQGYRPEWLALELSYLRRTVYATLFKGLLELDLSRLFEDLFELDRQLDADLLDSMREFGLQTFGPSPKPPGV